MRSFVLMIVAAGRMVMDAAHYEEVGAQHGALSADCDPADETPKLPPPPSANDDSLSRYENGEEVEVDLDAAPASAAQPAGPEMQPMCCCSNREPTPKYVCYDPKADAVYEPLQIAKPKKSNVAAAELFGMVEEITTPVNIMYTSKCASDGTTTHLKTPEIKPGAPMKAYLQAYPKNQWSKFTSPQSAAWVQEHKNYTVPKGVRADKHILLNGVIYGPTDKVKEAPVAPLHGHAYCTEWESTTSLKVTESKVKIGGPKFDPVANTWSFKTACKEVVDNCRKWSIGHACGFGTEAWFLKRVGRKGDCMQLPKKAAGFFGGGGATCPKGMFDKSVSTWTGEGGSTFKFCECDEQCQ